MFYRANVSLYSKKKLPVLTYSLISQERPYRHVHTYFGWSYSGFTACRDFADSVPQNPLTSQLIARDTIFRIVPVTSHPDNAYVFTSASRQILSRNFVMY